MTKRLFDLSVATVLVVLLLPAWALLAVVVKLSSPGPVVHRAERVGLGMRRFTLLKFRTMVLGAAALGPGVTTASDSRITAVGRHLRRWRLDETLQLVNVIRGDMSLVGPRPEDPRYTTRYTCAEKRVLTVRPGMTSPATLAFRHEELMLVGRDPERHYLAVILPEKLAMELAYLDERSLARDFLVLVRTLGALIVPSRPPPTPGPPLDRRKWQRLSSS